MDFEISRNVRLVGTEREWQLQRRKKVTRNGVTSEYWQPFRYYSRLDSAVRAMGEYDFRMSDDVDDLRRRLARVQAIAKNASQRINEACSA